MQYYASIRWMTTSILFVIACSTDAAKPPDDRFLKQYAETYRFTLGQPTAFQITDDGDAVLFLRSSPRSFVRDLYEVRCGDRQGAALGVGREIAARRGGEAYGRGARTPRADAIGGPWDRELRAFTRW